MKIKKITAREILDSRGNPTVEATVWLENGISAKASVPSGASTGIHEAWELRDTGAKRYGGKGVMTAVKNIEQKIAPWLKGKDVRHQQEIDAAMIELDNTPNKKKLGANAILGVSLACARAAALASKKPLYKYLRQAFRLPEKKWIMPYPTMNVINGGRHADNSLTIQEFMIVPTGARVSERVRRGAEVFQALKSLLHEAGYQTLVGDEGGFAPNFKHNEEALMFLVEAIKKAGYVPGKDVSLAMDMALSEYHDDKTGKYFLDDKKCKKSVFPEIVLQTLAAWVKKYPLISIEDPAAEDDWSTWELITDALGDKVALVGDDLFVTNVERLATGIERHVANAILIKVNQIGTLSETIQAIYLAKKHGYKVSVSHRSGETADTFIADLAVAVNADYLKSGSLSRAERTEKYNRLMEIEQELIAG